MDMGKGKIKSTFYNPAPGVLCKNIFISNFLSLGSKKLRKVTDGVSLFYS